ALFQLYQAGSISLEEALKNADSANNLRLRVKLAEDGDVFEAKKEKKSALKNNEDDKSKRTTETEIQLSVDY
ncbi:MAG: hypothetical protein KDD53_06780, partial [Bdellovibrionales bacterium]|nr:hypothetical protein [Bdellovibrionales bacterium]